jgi:D-alanyl-D-alanine carboxypeptidase
MTTVGSDGKTLSLFGNPIPGGINKAVVKDVEAINNAWKNSTIPAVKNYKLNTVGAGYNCRSVKGQPTKTSAHAFGLAIDINASTNPFEPGATTCKTDMPPEFVQLFKSQGWGWGGNWASSKDAMHFSKLSTEIGHTSPCGGDGGTNPLAETYDSVSNVGNIIYVKIKNYDSQKNPHSVLITRSSPNFFYGKYDNLTNITVAGIPVTLIQKSYEKIKGTNVVVSVSNKDGTLGNLTLLVK